MRFNHSNKRQLVCSRFDLFFLSYTHVNYSLLFAEALIFYLSSRQQIHSFLKHFLARTGTPQSRTQIRLNANNKQQKQKQPQVATYTQPQQRYIKQTRLVQATVKLRVRRKDYRYRSPRDQNHDVVFVPSFESQSYS